jgi:NADH dehydrogenase
MRPHVIVIGAGFGGLAVARALSRAPVRVTIVDRHNYHAFLPLLYQVATAGLEPQDIAFPVRGILRRFPNAVYRMGEIVRADLSAHALETATGERFVYDILVVAAGSRTETFGIPGVERSAYFLHTVDEARAFRNHVLRVLERADWTREPQERQRLLTFVVVGGGPTGVEIAGALGEFRRHVIPRDYPGIDPADVNVVLVEAGKALLGGMPEGLRVRALELVQALGVEVRIGTAVQRLHPDRVELGDGTRISTGTVLWAAGVRGATLGERLGLPTEPDGRVRVGPTLQVDDHPKVYVIGDLACVEDGASLPQIAPVAIQQGQLAARNIQRVLAGRPLETFRYRSQGQLATIGRRRAVAHVYGTEFSGFVAWVVWLTVHLIKLMGFRNRLVVFVNWVYNYFTYDRGVRSIVGAAGAPAGEAHREAEGPDDRAERP